MPLQYLHRSQSHRHATTPTHRQQHRLLHQRRNKPPTNPKLDLPSNKYGTPQRSLDHLRLQTYPTTPQTLQNPIPMPKRPNQLVLPSQRHPPHRQKTLHHLHSPTRMPHLRHRQPNQPRPLGRNDRTRTLHRTSQTQTKTYDHLRRRQQWRSSK